MEIARVMVSVGGDISDALNSLGQLDKAVQEAGNKSGMMGALSAAVSGVGAAAVAATAAVVALGAALASAVGGAALAAWAQLDEAADTFTLKTGLAGESLDGLTESATALYNSSAGLQSSMGDIATVMGTLEQITSAAGPALDNTAANVLYLKQAEGQAAGSTEEFARAMQSWNVPAEQMSAELDKQYVAFQAYGIGAGEINNALVQFGGQLRQMGLNLDQATGLLTGAYAAGVNVDKMLAALSTAAGKFAKDGVDMASGLRTAIDQIKAVENPTKAAQIAVDTFGARAGPALADAIRQGKVSLEGLSAQLGDTSGALKKAVEATMDFPEKLKLMGREAMTALQPLGLSIANSIGKALDAAKPGFDGFIASAKDAATRAGQAIETAVDNVMAGLKGKGLAGGFEALLASFNVDAATTVRIEMGFERIADAAQRGVDRVKAAASGFSMDSVNDALLKLAGIANQHTGLIVASLAAIAGGLVTFAAASAISAAVSAVSAGFTALAGAVALAATPMGIAVIAGGLLAAGLVTLAANNEGFRNSLASAIPTIQSFAANLQSMHDRYAEAAAATANDTPWDHLRAKLEELAMTYGNTADKAAIAQYNMAEAAQSAGQSIAQAVQEGDRWWAHGVATASMSAGDLVQAWINGTIDMPTLTAALMNKVYGVTKAGFDSILGNARGAASEYARILSTMAFTGQQAVGGAAVDLTKQESRAELKNLNAPLTDADKSIIGNALAQQTRDAERLKQQAQQAAGALGGMGQSLGDVGKAAGGTKKSAEEMAKQSAEALKAILESVEKMKEFLDKGYSSLVGDGALAGKITALSEALFATGRIFVDQLATAMAGLSEKSAKAADLGGQAIGHAASALKSMVELLPKMWDFSKTDAWGAVQSSPALFTQMSATLIDMGRAFFDQMAAASTGIEENSVKAAQLLATGIQASSQAISSVISAVKGMWEMYASGLWDEVQANRALLLQMSQWLIDMGREMFNQFAAAAQGVDENAVKAAGLLSQGIQSATSAIGATLKLVQDLLLASFDPSFMDALFGETRGRIMEVARALIDFGRSVFEAFAAAAAGVKERTVAAAKLLADGVKAAADGLKAAADSLRLLLDVASQPDMLTAIGLIGDGKLRAWVLVIGSYLAQFARDIIEAWGAAGLSLGSRVVAAAKRLEDGVKAASDGLKAASDALRLLLDTAAQPELVAAMGLVGDGRLHNWIIAIAGYLAQFAAEVTSEWGRVGATLGSVAVAGAKRLADGAKAASDGIGSVVATIRTLADSTRLIVEAQAILRPDMLLLVTSWFANVALIISGEWGRVGAWLSDAAVSGAKRLSDGADAVSKGVVAVASTIRTFVESQWLLLDAQSILNPATLLLVTSWFANVALIVAGEWGRVGAWLSSGAASGGKALADGMDATAKGVGAVVTTLQAFVDSTHLVASAQTLLTPASLSMVTSWFANIGLIMASEWGRVGAVLSSGAQTGAKTLADGMASVAGGVQSVVTTVQAYVDSASLIVKAQAILTPTMLTNITSLFANIGLIMASEWGRVGAALSGPALAGAKALSDGMGTVASGVKSVADTLTLLTGKDLVKAVAALPTTDFVGWLTNVTSFLANVALIMVNEWGRVGAALSAGAGAGAAQLSSGIGSVSSALSSTIDTLKALADWLKKPVEYTSQIEQAAVTLAQDAAALWVAIANALAKLSPPTEAQTEAVKTWTSLSDFTSQAMSMLDVLPKLRDWTKAPVELSDAMLSETDTLARAWVTIWRKIAVALIAIGSPDEAQAAAVKAWSDVGDFLSNVASLFDLLPKLAAWTKTPTELSSDMLTSVDTLARNWVAIWRKIADALIAVGSPTDAQTAAVKAWSEVSDFLGNVASLFDLLPKLAAWVKAPTELSNDMLNATDTLARAWVTIWRKIADALIAVGSPSDAQTAATKAWTEVSDFLGNVSSLFDLLPKLRDWTKAPVELSDAMLSETDTLARAWVTIWRKIADALVAVGSPSDAQTAAVKAWSEVSDFMGSVASLFDFLPKLRDWVKSPTELNADMLNATDTLARDWVSLWQKIADALIAVGSPSDAQKAAVKAWAEVSDFLGNVANLFDLLPKLRDWVKSPVELSTDMTNAAGTLATQWTVLWAKIADALLAVAVPSDVQKAAVKAWSEAGDFMSQITGMMDTLTKLHDWLKESHQLTQPTQDEAANLATEFTVLWKKIADTLKDITPPTDVQKAAVEAWTKVADAFGIIDKTLSTIKSLMEFSFTTKVGDTSVTQTSIPAVATIQQRVKDALAVGVMMLQAIVTAAQDPTLANDLTTAAQEASAALAKVAGDAFTVIGGVLSTVKSLFEFGVNNPAGWVQQQGGNNIWSSGSFTAGIPDATAVTAKVTALMAALKAIVDEVKNGVANIALSEDPAALQAKLAQVLAIVSTAAALVKAAQDMAAGGTGKFALSISIAVAFTIPDLAAEIAKINVPVIHIPVVWDVPPLPTGNSGSGYVSGAPGNSGSASLSSAPGNSGSGSVTSITVNQYVSPQIAADPAGTIIQLKGLYA